MYYYLKDFCALILSGVTLYNGLETNYGFVAVYGNGEEAHTLYKYEGLNSREEIQMMLKNDPRINQDKVKYFEHGPISVKICFPRASGIDKLKNYLSILDFKTSDQSYEKEATFLFMNKSKKKGLLSNLNIFRQYTLNNIPQMGREIAAAVTTGQVRLTGPFGCASSKNNRAPYQIKMDSPLDIGNIAYINKVEHGNEKQILTYINGNLRVLTRARYPINREEKVIWDIEPKFDATEKNGLMDRYLLDRFMYYYYDYAPLYVVLPEYGPLLIGCPTSLVIRHSANH